MGDIFDQQKRSEIMSNVKTSGTDIEEALLKCARSFWTYRRYRKNYKSLPGCPDVVFTRDKVAIFADGDFWHGKDFEEWKDSIPEFWKNKITKNKERDKRQTEELHKNGYTVLRFWGSFIKKHPDKVQEEIADALDIDPEDIQA